MEKYSKRNITPFNGEKYNVWKFRIMALLKDLRAKKVVTEDPPSPMTVSWENAEATAKNAIIEYLSDSYIDFAKDEFTTKQVFENLDAIYARKGLTCEYSLRQRLSELKFKGDSALIEHFTEFDILVNELAAAGAVFSEREKIINLFMSLPSSYDAVMTALKINGHIQTLAYVKTELLDHEIKLKRENRDTSKKVLNAAQEEVSFKTENFRPHNQKKLIKNRQSNTPYRKNQHKKPFFNQKKEGFIIKCHHCGRKGHKRADCFYYKKSMKHSEGKGHQGAAHTAVEEAKTEAGFTFMAGNYSPSGSNEQIHFLLDSGASDHLINRADLFSECMDLQPPTKISVAKQGVFIAATKRGTIQVESNLGIKGALENVLYCPEVPHNLLSVRKMQEAGMSIIFDNEGVQILKDGKVIMMGKNMHNLTTIDFKIIRSEIIDSQANSAFINDYNLWHQRLGHIGKEKFLELKLKKLFLDSDQIDKITFDNNLCEACINGKQARKTFEKKKDKEHIIRPLFIVHTDVCGPITPSTIDHKNYFVFFIDEFTHYCITYLISHKSDVFSVFKDFVGKSEAHFNLKIVNLYCDNGREYLSNEMKQFCVNKGISYHLTVPRTPQLNGLAERMVRTMTEKARTMLSGAKLSKVFWGEAVLTATYLINRTPTKALKQNKTPFELWHNKRPTLKFLKVFGSTAYVHNKTMKTKFDEKSWKGILVGYEPNGYKVYDAKAEKFVTVRDVIFDEKNYVTSRPQIKFNDENNETDASDVESKSVEKPCEKIKKARKELISTDETDKMSVNSESDSENLIENSKGQYKNKPAQIESNTQNKNINEPRRSERFKEKSRVSYDEIYDDYLMCAHLAVFDIPTSFDNVKYRDDRYKWEQAINEEINSLIANKTWILVEKPKDKNIVDCKWVFTIKNDEFGNPLRYKARLVARGFSQEYLVDYSETFAPVARISSFRFIIAFANQNNLLIHHMDVKSAYLNGELKEEIYMKVPEGVKCNKNQVCKLIKALYGLKQAAKCWFETFEKKLIDIGFRSSSVDRCIYILDKGIESENIYVVLYVDDLVIVTARIEIMNSFKNYLKKTFFMSDLNEIKLFLGIKIERNNNEIVLHQSGYIKTVLEKFNMQDCNPACTPLPNKLNFEALNSDEKYNAPCRNVIGCLMYIMVCTRPDLCFAVNLLSRYSNKENRELWQNLKRVLRYLKGSIDIKLTYKKCDYNVILSGYVDSDWGGDDLTDRKSTTGYLFKLYNKCTICWNTRKQASVAVSSTEAEYMALFEAVKEAKWLKSLATSININNVEPIIIYEDNNGCISIANNPTSHKRSKHIDIKYHFSREQVERGLIKLIHMPTGCQTADILTKPLPIVKFSEHRAGLGLQ